MYYVHVKKNAMAKSFFIFQKYFQIFGSALLSTFEQFKSTLLRTTMYIHKYIAVVENAADLFHDGPTTLGAAGHPREVRA